MIRYFFKDKPKINHVDYLKESGTVTLNLGKYRGVFEFAYLQTNRFWQEGLEILFSHGSIKLKLPPAFLKNQSATVIIHKDKINQDFEIIKLKSDWSWSFKRQAESFVKSITSGSESISSGIDGIEDLRFIENIWRNIVKNI